MVKAQKTQPKATPAVRRGGQMLGSLGEAGWREGVAKRDKAKAIAD